MPSSKPKQRKGEKNFTQVQLNARWRKKNKAKWAEVNRKSQRLHRVRFPEEHALQEQRRFHKKQARKLLELYYTITGIERNERVTNDQN